MVDNVDQIDVEKIFSILTEVIYISSATSATIQKDAVEKYREPNLDDGADIWNLIKDTKVLDLNSSYSYLMWCSYFSETSIVIELKGKVVGFVSGFIKPTDKNRLFIWQVAVDESERGKGYASKMLNALLERENCADVKYLETTISPSNMASQKLFHGLARDLDTKIHVNELFTATDFPEEGHEDELIHQIGPF